MKSQELRQKPKEELEELLRDSREKLRQLKFDLASGKVKNVREIRSIKKDIARILTILKTHAPLETSHGADSVNKS